MRGKDVMKLRSRDLTMSFVRARDLLPPSQFGSRKAICAILTRTSPAEDVNERTKNVSSERVTVVVEE